MYIKPIVQGNIYKGGHMSGFGRRGQVIRIVGNDLFTVNVSAEIRPFGILTEDVNNYEVPSIYFMGGIYETDCFREDIKPGDNLKVSAYGWLTNNVHPFEVVIAQAIAVSDGVLKFRLLI